MVIENSQSSSRRQRAACVSTRFDGPAGNAPKDPLDLAGGAECRSAIVVRPNTASRTSNRERADSQAALATANAEQEVN